MVTTWLPHIQIMCEIPCAENSPISLLGIWNSAPFLLLMHVSVMTQASHHIPPVTLLLNYQVWKTWKMCIYLLFWVKQISICVCKMTRFTFCESTVPSVSPEMKLWKWYTDQSDFKLTTTIRPLIFQLNAILHQG